MSDSWMSGASLESTVKALSYSAIKGQTDYLEGIKENIILSAGGNRISPLRTDHTEEIRDQRTLELKGKKNW